MDEGTARGICVDADPARALVGEREIVAGSLELADVLKLNEDELRTLAALMHAKEGAGLRRPHCRCGFVLDDTV